MPGALLVASVVVVLWVQRPSAVHNRFDFRIYYSAIRSHAIYGYRLGQRRYGFVYPPFAAAIVWPLTRFRFAVADGAWLVFSMIGAITLLGVSLRRSAFCRARPAMTLTLAAVLLWTAPIQQTFKFGQINLWLGALVAVDFFRAIDGRPNAGVLIGIAAAMKFTPAIALLALCQLKFLPVWRRVALSFATCTALGFVLMPATSSHYWTSAIFDVGRTDHPASTVNNSLGRLVALFGMGELSGRIVVVCLAVLLVVVAVRRSRTALRDGDPLVALTIASCCGYAISPVSWTHHLLFFVLCPVIILGARPTALRIVGAAFAVATILEFSNVGQQHGYVNIRAVLLPLVVCALPISRQVTEVQRAEGAPAVR